MTWKTIGVLFVLAVASQSFAASVDVYVGYADNLRPSPFFPTPWDGSASVALFAGQSGATFDSGAVRVHNGTGASVTIDSLVVQLKNGAGPTFNLWSGVLPFVLLDGKDAIFTQSSFSENFDSSDFGFVPVNVTNNCSIGPLSTTATCTSNTPLVNLSVDGVAHSFVDSAHVLDTGGFDLVNANPCPNIVNSPGACNESLQWRLIGTTGISNPGGGSGVPEPSTVGLLGGGLFFVLGSRQFKKRRV